MIAVHRFASFSEAKDPWMKLEKSIAHYPFQSFWYQQLFAKDFAKSTNVFLLGVYDDDQLLAIGGFEKSKTTVGFLGTRDVSTTAGLSQDITDFGDILYADPTQNAEIWQAITAYFKDYHTLLLDYVRQDSPTYQFFHKTTANITEQATSPFLYLPPTWEEYLAQLSKKDRHELKRKINRLESQTTYKICEDHSIQGDFEEFIRLHRLSDVQKEKFMTEKMKHFFWQLLMAEKDTWQVHICSMLIDKKDVSAVMVFTNKDYILLYNSGYEPTYKQLSVGLLTKAFLLKKSITDGKKVYDFLRGNERYKYDLGAKDMPLFRIRLQLG